MDQNDVMTDKELFQLMWEGYHSVEKIAELANLPVHYIEDLFAKHLREEGIDEQYGNR